MATPLKAKVKGVNPLNQESKIHSHSHTNPHYKQGTKNHGTR